MSDIVPEEFDLEHFFEFSLDLLCIADHVGRFLKVNHAWETVLGYATEDLLHKGIIEFVHDDDQKATREAFHRLHQQQHIQNLVNRFINQEGTYRYMEWHCYPHGSLVYAVVRDVSEREHIQQELASKNAQIKVANEELHAAMEEMEAMNEELVGSMEQLEASNDMLEVINERFGQLTSISRTYIWEVDTEGLFTYVSEGIQKVLGYRPENVIRKMHFYDLHPPKDREAFIQAVFEVISRKESFNDLVNPVQSVYDELVWVSTNGVPVLDDDQQLIGYRGSDTDITEQKVLKEDLQLSEIRYRTLFHESPYGVLLIDPEGRDPIEFNDTACRQLGYSREAFSKVGVNDYEVIETPDETAARIGRILDGSVEDFETIHRKKDGQLMDVRVLARLIEISGRKLIQAMFLDITQRKEAERAFQYQIDFQKMISEISSSFIKATTDNIGEKIQHMLEVTALFFDVDRSYVFQFSEDHQTMSNTHYWSAPGISRELAMIENVPMDSLPWFSQQIIAGQIVHIPDISQLPDQARVEKKTWNTLQIQSLLLLPLMIRGEYVGFFGFDSVREQREWDHQQRALLQVVANTLSEALESHQMEEEMRQARKQAEAASIAKSQFLANMSHEIRTPLNGIVGFLHLLENSELNWTQREFVGKIQTSTQTLLTVINDILDVSKIEAGKLEFEMTPFCLHEALESAVVPFTAIASDKGLTLRVKIGDEVPEYVMGDPTRIRQVISNLVSNAVKFADSGDIAITLDAQPQDDHQTHLVSISVQDQGIGISKSDLKKLFQPFSQADTSSTRQFGGTGLGLVIVKTIVEMMHGQINVESQVGKGSTFTLTIPFSKAETLPEKRQRNYDELPGKRAMVVDHQTENRHHVSRVLEEVGCIVTQAEDALKAMSRLIHSEADEASHVVIIQDQMPKMGGFDLCTALKAISTTKDIPLILMTATYSRDDEGKLKEAGFAGYIQEPFETRHLLDTVLTVLKGQDVEDRSGDTHVQPIGESKTFSDMKILLAEDHPINRDFFVQLLKTKGYSCDTVENGLEALDACKKKAYDLVFMDCQMPVMDGYEATKKIREFEGDGRHTPIIALTAYAMKGDAQRCEEAGMDDYLSKPVNLQQVEEALSRHADHRKKEARENTYIVVIKRMIEETGFDQSTAEAFLMRSAQDIHEKLTNLTILIQSGQIHEVSKVLHQLKGVTSSLRLVEVAQKIAIAEDWVRDHRPKQDLVALVEEVCEMLQWLLKLKTS